MHRTAIYLIRIAGSLTEPDTSWFEDLTVCPSAPDEMLLRTPAIDQSALHGILATLRDLAIPLLGVQQLDPPPDQ